MKKLHYIDLIIRFWMAYILISNSGVGTLTPLEELGLPPHVYQIIKGMWDTGFLMHLVKIIELLGGLALLFNFMIPLTVIALVPVVINIYGIHIFLFDAYLTNGLWMLLILAFLTYRHWSRFAPLIFSGQLNKSDDYR